uniref:Uncharacterized protein n=1 Tax=Homalodisca liturata TaxID=320908 RepID=A0A1B6HDB8_9HEMI
MFTTNIPPRKVRRMMKKQRMLEEKIKNAKQSFSHSGPSGSGFMKPEISRNFGSVPSIGASLNSLVQTTPGVQTTRFGPVNHQSTEIKPSLAEQFKPTFPAFQSLTPSTSILPQNNKEDKQITVDPNPSESFTNIQNVEINGINPKSPFPKLLIFKGCAKQYCGGVQFLRKSFYYSIYGPLTCLKEQCGDVVKARLWVAGNCVCEGQGYTSIEAEFDAMYKLFQELRTTNYYIELKDSYMPGKKKTFPPFLSNVDPSLSHIYKVVCLRKRDGSTFVHNIQGAVDYVSSARELLDYIKNHGNTGSKADLFIFNVDKSQRTEIYRACSAVGMKGRPLIGCSDGGVMAYFPEKPWEILQDLLKCGGETIKYRLFPPGSDLESELVGDRRKSTVNELVKLLLTDEWLAEQPHISRSW